MPNHNPLCIQEQSNLLYGEQEHVTLPPLAQERGNPRPLRFQENQGIGERGRISPRLQPGYGQRGQFGWNCQNPAQDHQFLNPKLLPHSVDKH